MTNSPADNQPAPSRAHSPTPPGSKWQRASLVIQVVVSLAVVAGMFAYLLWTGTKTPSAEDDKRPARPEEVVQIVGPRQIRVRPGTPVDHKLHVATVEAAWLTAPVLPVTGTTLASLRAGKEASPDSWQFATPELLTAFADWQKAVKDIQFQETQLKAVRELNQSKIDAQKKVVARVEQTVKAGVDSEKDLAVERTNLIQFTIQGRKDIHDQEQTVYLAHRAEATLARQLQQAGLDPAILRAAAAGGDIIVAEVPEREMGRVKIGMSAQVRFFGLPGRVFTGNVSSLSPVIAREKRVLNVQFTVQDPENLVRPGMFAEIGLGTDRRQALLMPADGVLHVGDSDYALRETEPATYQILEVQTGELRGTRVEVLAGLEAGARVLGQGAILLKPVVARAIQGLAPGGTGTGAAGGGKNP